MDLLSEGLQTGLINAPIQTRPVGRMLRHEFPRRTHLLQFFFFFHVDEIKG